MMTNPAVGPPPEESDAELTEGALREAMARSVELPSAPDQDGKLVVGTVSWAKEGATIDAGRFLASLQRIERRCHVVLCAGMALVNELPPEDILRASGGSPVIFERADGRWRIAFSESGKDATRTLRTKQEMPKGKFLITSGPKSNLVARAFARAEGIVSIAPLGVRMALILCGENSAFARSPGACVFKFGKGNDLPEAFRGSWILLNPAHHPYGRGSQKGLTKVERVGGKGPTLARLASSSFRFTDGTKLPRAVVHCNNFVPDAPSGDARRAYASVVFAGKILARPSAHTLDADDARICIHELPLKEVT